MENFMKDPLVIILIIAVIVMVSSAIITMTLAFGAIGFWGMVTLFSILTVIMLYQQIKLEDYIKRKRH